MYSIFIVIFPNDEHTIAGHRGWVFIFKRFIICSDTDSWFWFFKLAYISSWIDIAKWGAECLCEL